MAISLDIKNAFYFITWDRVIDALRELNVLMYMLKMFGFYFSDSSSEFPLCGYRVH